MRNYLFCLLLLSSTGTLAQISLPGAREGGVNQFDQFVVSDWARKAEKTIPKYQGTPYLLEEWTKADIVTLEDHVFTDIIVKYDLYQQFLFYKPLHSSDSTIVEHDLIKQFNIKGTDSTYVFHKFLVPIERQAIGMEEFFIVLDSGAYVLLAQPRKRLQATGQSTLTKASSDDVHRFVDEVAYFIRRPDRRVMEARGSKKHRQAIFGEDYVRIADHVKHSGIGWKKREDLEEIVAFANR